MMPKIVFFTELDANALHTLLARPGVLDLLAQMRCSVSMALIERDAVRAQTVRTLAERGIGVHARLLLSEDAGIWFNVDNYPQAIARYHAFRRWARDEHLPFEAVGLDMEPPLYHLPRREAPTPWTMLQLLVAAHSNTLFPAASRAYADLAAEIRADGYAVHAYQYPLIIDDRRADATLFQRALHVVDLPADVEVLLCYSSAVPRAIFGSDLGGALIAEYGPYADSVGVGSTGGGLDVEALDDSELHQLGWAAFARDLRLAAFYADMIHIFSLEGTVTRSFLERLTTFDWDTPTEISGRHRTTMALVRAAINAALWWSRWGWGFLGWLGWVVVGIIAGRRAFQRWKGNP
jgi:hypothetical protein